MARILSKSVVSVALVSVAVIRASPAPSRSGDFDLTELMNKFLTEYESGHGGPPVPGTFEQHQEEISYDPEPEPHHHHHHPQQYTHEAEAHMYQEQPRQQYYQQQHQQHQQQQQQYYQKQETQSEERHQAGAFRRDPPRLGSGQPPSGV